MENKEQMGYSFGCSLESLEVYAVDRNNQKVFIDRSKLDMSEALLRKKVEMKNLAIYCNYGKQDFLSALDQSQEGRVSELMMSLILRSGKVEPSNRNNYVLIMNVSGMVNETHTNDLIKYCLDLNF